METEYIDYQTGEVVGSVQFIARRDDSSKVGKIGIQVRHRGLKWGSKLYRYS